MARRKSAYMRDFEQQVAWLSVHAPRSAVSALMRVNWKNVGPDSADASLSGIEEFSRLGEKIDRRRFDILRTIRSGLSNARLEAVNNKIKTTIKIGYGYRNLGNLIALVMLKCGGLNLQLPGRQ
ncbi:transposase [Bifidobacterium longum subsp. infantis]|nr:transposase [Bifidobacterium longum]